MRLFMLALCAGVALSACGAQNGDTTDNTDGGGGGSAGMDTCNVLYFADSCGACGHEHCCAEFAACARVPYCLTCSSFSRQTPECDELIPLTKAIRECETAHCAVPCGHVQ